GLKQTSRSFLYVLSVDMALASSILLTIFLVRPDTWLLMMACGILASSPDVMWLPNWVRTIQEKEPKPHGLLARFHARIQWSQTPLGLIPEILFFGVVGFLALSASV